MPGCRTPASGSLSLKDSSDNRSDKVMWKWTKGAATTAEEFGNPVSGSTTYRLCIYDEEAGTPNLVLGASAPPGGLCAGRPCWKQSGRTTPTGYTYSDRDLTRSGLSKIVLRAGGAGQAKISVRGKGANLPMPLPAVPGLLKQDTRVTVQLLKSDGGACWEAVYPAPAVRNSLARFSDRIP